MGSMTRTTRTYGHFCMLARALEQVGDRWTLLVVRDLLTGPRRFTDLMALLGGITPKTLSQRLRELEDAGIAVADREPGRREVWYRLTPAGEDLAPAVHALFHWGMRHARRPPAPGEVVHPEHLLKALRLVLDQTSRPRSRSTWHFTFTDGGEYTLAFSGEAWTLRRGHDGDADVAVTTTADAWIRFLMVPPGERPRSPAGIDISGAPRAVDRYRRLLAGFPGEGSAS